MNSWWQKLKTYMLTLLWSGLSAYVLMRDLMLLLMKSPKQETVNARNHCPPKRSMAVAHCAPQQALRRLKYMLAFVHEHHDFFLASQHPSARPALSRLADKYSMSARIWRHGIQSFLEVVRHRLPKLLEYMLAFIYIAYSMMALLYETVSTSKTR